MRHVLFKVKLQFKKIRIRKSVQVKELPPPFTAVSDVSEITMCKYTMMLEMKTVKNI